MKILAIETSCDETAIAVLEISEKQNSLKFNLLSNQVLSQIKIHKKFGGVVPNLAMREHRKNLPILLKEALREGELISNFQFPISKPKVDAIAVTYGPGLEPALWEGINFAKDLAKKWPVSPRRSRGGQVPLVGVNHLEGHIYASWLENAPPKFPLLALIASGGHTELVLMKKHLNYKILGETRDDAAGEAFDKVARMLGLGYPGGPEISKLAERWKTPGNGLFPRPMINSGDFDFSFSGLKTAVLYYLRDNPRANKAAIAYEFQQATIDVLVKKTADALRKYKVKSLVVGGGVTANKLLRSSLSNRVATSFPKISLHVSPLWLCGDNAAMIAVVGYFKARAKKFSKPEKIKAQGNLRLS
ncbi:MAG: putative tRNA threonylcarbamoyladenosine biosynthesis protein Gcp [Candidatus Giovannonibacteria bacterium GW2011_GWC2_44_9]|uniref:tRNA N6-adenosine threonylcarbamoyltransferase n=3 Tax=Candidatus Giovannoniibacteriota TaxID=1752738 RepID=A0A0G1IUW3_9BACT|nr:MAG: putative tRNA threonylcarbamoyladenosine biosynthesis protein Gcp [Candidatus Giovannonibacteria bacterium GW2011_GWB1_44_23]KKT62753.1 MAG: putative tRNA threonylcarbamoyladenosine biosynthesis protein Gcp [Candidatus Giovannonibacteria bacterium GW2011_GWA1_44_29]KKT83785.1 MAG: putative tRNA threonylcarbamoyladenosine biosynthesis protein Gcp [Candidatus Giovannonibacteria bacterium GW2011_GWC2_44_9]